eukprot:TRINITY_DN22663_c0_g1_i2.p1 TRINITY_DN22663_c0_g1~~TRINITY_DN22663_c0_g1_i2.p1  ORF type:complete len:774 (-),score=135.44 TRINITY_DN22663_c0_g1_i2:61-2382(-)
MDDHVRDDDVDESKSDTTSTAPVKSDSLSMGQQRLILNHEVGKHFRRKAARYQKRRKLHETLYKLRWSLQPLISGQPMLASTDTLLADIHEKEGDDKEDQELVLPLAPPPSPVDVPREMMPEESPQRCNRQNDSDWGHDADEPKNVMTETFLNRMADRPHVLSEARRRRLETRRRERRMAEKLTAEGKSRDEIERLLRGGGANCVRGQADESSNLNDTEPEVNASAYLSHVRPKESEAYEVIFQLYQDSSAGTVDHADLRGLLSDLGFRPCNEEERQLVVNVLLEVHSLEVDFTTLVKHVIPKIRVGLAEARRPQILELFYDADTDNSGSLSVEEFVFILHRSGYYPTPSDVETAVLELLPDAKNRIQNMHGELLMSANILQLSHVRALAPILQERAGYNRVLQSYLLAEELCLHEEIRLLWHEALVDCRNAFFNLLDVNQTLLPVESLVLVLVEIDLIPKQGNVRQVLQALVEEELQGTDDKRFVEFFQCLRILSRIRAKECERVCEVFCKNDSDGTNGLSLAECLKCLEECGIKARNARESSRIMHLVDEFDADGSGELELTEFLGLVKFVAVRIHKMRQRDQADIAASYGWSQEMFDDMRMAFLAADDNMDRSLNKIQLASCLTKIRPNWRASKTSDLLQEMGLMHTGFEVNVDLFQLLDVVRFMDRRMGHWDIASSVGLDSESQDQFIASWLKLEPDWEEDMVPIQVLIDATQGAPGYPKRMARIQELINAGNTKLNFIQYIMIMRRAYHASTNVEEKRALQLSLTRDR